MFLFLPGSLQKLMDARIDARFEENYQHLVDKDNSRELADAICNLSHCSADQFLPVAGYNHGSFTYLSLCNFSM